MNYPESYRLRAVALMVKRGHVLMPVCNGASLTIMDERDYFSATMPTAWANSMLEQDDYGVMRCPMGRCKCKDNAGKVWPARRNESRRRPVSGAGSLNSLSR